MRNAIHLGWLLMLASLSAYAEQVWPRSDFAISYPIDAMHVIFREGAGFPIAFQDTGSVYFLVNFGDQQHFVAWPRSDAAAAVSQTHIIIRKERWETFHRAYLFFRRDTAYTVRQRNEKVVNVLYEHPNGLTSVRLDSGLFALSPPTSATP